VTIATHTRILVVPSDRDPETGGFRQGVHGLSRSGPAIAEALNEFRSYYQSN
jgi:hypothetical protein